MEEKLPAVITPKELDTKGIKIVDDQGREIVRPDVIAAVTQLASLAQLARIRKSLEREHIEGHQYFETLDASAIPHVIDLIREEPYCALATVSFFNDGPDAVHISINERHGSSTLEDGEQHSADYTKADRRVELIYYWCDTGETASVRVVGKY